MTDIFINSINLECPVCLDPFKKPRVFPCGHSFCEKCVITIVSTNYNIEGNNLIISCPECAYKFSFRSINILPINYKLLSIIENSNDILNNNISRSLPNKLSDKNIPIEKKQKANIKPFSIDNSYINSNEFREERNTKKNRGCYNIF